MYRLQSLAAAFVFLAGTQLVADDEAALPRAIVDGTGPGWAALGESDFVNVNCEDDTWSWTDDGVIHCTGKPVGVMRTEKIYQNVEIVVEWRHLEFAGNSGVFVWTPPSTLEGLQPGKLPGGIEVQVLDLGYETRFEERTGKKPDWFTSHGDVFPVGGSDMKPFPPVAPNGKRSFPSQRLSRKAGEWNHYYIRAINGEVRLWVNGVEVSGGTECNPREGYICLESEGAPVEFRNLKMRELP